MNSPNDKPAIPVR